MFKVRIQVLVPSSEEIPSGVYLRSAVTLPDRLWEQTLRDINSLIDDMNEYDREDDEE